MDEIGMRTAVARRFEIRVFQLFDGEILVEGLLEGEFDVFRQLVEHFRMGQFDRRDDLRVRGVRTAVVVPCVFGEGAARAKNAEDFAFDARKTSRGFACFGDADGGAVGHFEEAEFVGEGAMGEMRVVVAVFETVAGDLRRPRVHDDARTCAGMGWIMHRASQATTLEIFLHENFAFLSGLGGGAGGVDFTEVAS